MKALQYMLIFLMLTSCKGGLLENKSYNSIRTEFELKNHLVLYEDGFNYEITGDTSEKRIITSCHFVSKKPYRKDEQGNWYYRWTLCEEKFTSVKHAVNHFNEKARRLITRDADEMIANKGDNTRTIICENVLYSVSASCREGWRVDEWFEKLTMDILGVKTVEQNTILETDCGGGYKIK